MRGGAEDAEAVKLAFMGRGPASLLGRSLSSRSLIRCGILAPTCGSLTRSMVFASGEIRDATTPDGACLLVHSDRRGVEVEGNLNLSANKEFHYV